MTRTVSPLYTNLFPASLLDLLPSGVDSKPLWAGAVIPVQPSISRDQAEKILSVQEATTWQQYKLAKRRDEYLAGRLAAKIAVCELRHSRNLPPPDFSAIHIENFADGHPFCRLQTDSAAAPEISISHSGVYAAALVSCQPCGIDIQQRQDKLTALQSRFAHISEVAELRRRHPHMADIDLLNLIWAAKEAIRKLLSRRQLPGFLEMRLSAIRRMVDDATLLQFAIEQDHTLAKVSVRAMFLTPSYALAITLPEGYPNA